jgi:transcription elongation factor Elf1
MNCPFCGESRSARLEDILDEGVFYCHSCNQYMVPVDEVGEIVPYGE